MTLIGHSYTPLMQPQVANTLAGLFSSMNKLGINILERTDSMMVIIQSNNIGIV